MIARLRALCRRWGVQTFACEHSWTITEDGLDSKFIARRMTGHYVGEVSIKVIDELYCIACGETVAVCCGSTFVTINENEDMAHPAILMATKSSRNWMDDFKDPDIESFTEH